VYAHRLELLAHGVGDGGLAAVGEHDRRAVCRVQREQLQPGLDVRHLRKQRVDVLRADRLHIGDLPVAEVSQRFGGYFDLCHGSTARFRWHGPLAPVPITRWSPFRFPYSDSVMAIDLTTRSGCGRTRSINNNPFFKSALSTSMPSASTKLRWNCRAAMPRCRYWRLLSSCCRPRMTNWLSSSVTSSCSRVKPATASVIRSRSGLLASRATRSML